MFVTVLIVTLDTFAKTNRCILICFSAIAFCRSNEIVFAFYRDAFDRLKGAEPTTEFTREDRLSFVTLSYFEIIVCFGFSYIGLQGILNYIHGGGFQTYKTDFSSLFEAILFSGNVITTLGYGEHDPVAWPAKILTLWEVFSGFVLFAVALAVYLGSERTVPGGEPHD